MFQVTEEFPAAFCEFADISLQPFADFASRPYVTYVTYVNSASLKKLERTLSPFVLNHRLAFKSLPPPGG